MTKIKNTGVYIKETEPTLSDFLVGTKDSNGKTKSFSLEAILQLLNSSNGVNNIQFKFSNGSHPTIDFLSEGYFFTDTNTMEVGTFTELIFNKETLQPLDLSPLFNKLGELENVVIKLENPEDPNNFFNFKVVSFTDNTDYFTFGIEDFNELYLGEFENEKIYSFYFDILSESNFYITGTNDDAGGIKTGSITKRGELVIDSEEGNISGLVLNQVPNLVVTAYTIITPNTGENEPYIRPIGCMGNDDFYYVPMYPGIRKVNTTTGVIEDFSTFIGEPTAVCLGLDGFFYVLVSNSIIRIHPTTGAVMSTIYSGVNLSNAQCLVHATDNNIYIGFSVSPEGLGRLTLAGDLTIFSTIDGHCLYIDQGSDGLLYCNTGSRIYKATLDGIQTDFITLPTILALYCATDGFIYTHRYGLGILYKITYSGTIEELPVGLGEVIRAIDQSQNGTFYFNSENVVGKLNLPSNKVLKTDENGNVVKTTYLEDVQYLVPTDILGKEDKINKGVANGYAGLDSDGFVPLSQTNPSVLGRLVVVADQTARFALTTAIVQNGDTVKQLDVEIMYYVKDDTNLSNSNGYELYRAGTAASVPWTGVTGTPTSISGYGIIPASGDYTTALVTETTNKNYQTDNQKLFNDATSSIQNQLNTKALDSNVIHTTGDETKAGVLTLNDGLKINPTALNIPSTVSYVSTFETNGTMGRVLPQNITIPQIPVSYIPTTPTIGGHLSGIDNALDNLGFLNIPDGTNTVNFTINGVNARVITSTDYSINGQPKKLAIFFHYYGGNYSTAPSPNLKDALLANGYSIATISAGDSWGNENAQQLYLKLYDYVIKKFNLDKQPIAVSTSMGTLTSLNILNRKTIPFRAAVSVVGVVNLSDYYVNHVGVASGNSIETAYNFITPSDNVKAIFGFDPFTGLKYNFGDTYYESACPIYFVNGDLDTSTPLTYTQQIFTGLEVERSNSRLNIVVGGTHDVNIVTPAIATDIISWLSTNTLYSRTIPIEYPTLIANNNINMVDNVLADYQQNYIRFQKKNLSTRGAFGFLNPLTLGNDGLGWVNFFGNSGIYANVDKEVYLGGSTTVGITSKWLILDKDKTINNGSLGVGVTPITKFQVEVASSTGISSSNGIRISNGLMGLNLGVETTGSYSWIQSTLGGVGQKSLALNPNGGNIGFGGITVPTAIAHIGASTTAKASIRLTVSPAPTTPNDGDIWLESNTNTGLKMRIAGVTKTVSLI